MGKKPIIGILGGICSGKSTVASEFGRLGCAVIDADKIAKQLLDEPTVGPRIVKLFGNDILDAGGKIDRNKLAKLFFPTKPGLQISQIFFIRRCLNAQISLLKRIVKIIPSRRLCWIYPFLRRLGGKSGAISSFLLLATEKQDLKGRKIAA
jgi:hypothetical protein